MDLLSKAEYDSYCNRFRLVWNYLQECSYDVDSVVEKICELRGYSVDGNMPSMLKRVGFVYLDPDVFKPEKLKKLDSTGDLGIYTKEGKFLLEARFIFPVKDMLNNIIALIGWFPDEKKYITTPSKLFSKKALFFGMEQLGTTGIGKDYFIVEGIFDSISIRAQGFNCVALMGISVSNYTEILYSLFKRVVAIPDNDFEGRKVVKEDKWRLPFNSKYLCWNGKFKDIDDVLKYYDMSDIFKEVWKEPENIITIDF